MPKLKKRPVSGPTTMSSATVQVEQKSKRVTSEDSKGKADSVSVANTSQVAPKQRVSTKSIQLNNIFLNGD